MNRILSVYKPRGKTPLQMVENIKQHFPDLADETVSYAGRLDPMAEGLLLLLIGDENKKRKDYEDLVKTYEVEILIGLSTDSYDLLGKITAHDPSNHPKLKTICDVASSFLGEHEFPYPPYSSKPVNGKPLYYWARKNELASITIPTKRIEIISLTLETTKEITGKEVATNATSLIETISGDFRQEEILTQWRSFKEANEKKTYMVVKLLVVCSSGSYMRTLAHLLGEKLDSSALAYSIKRTQIGTLTLKDCIYLDDRERLK